MAVPRTVGDVFQHLAPFYANFHPTSANMLLLHALRSKSLLQH